jgi:hypothetical protein
MPKHLASVIRGFYAGPKYIPCAASGKHDTLSTWKKWPEFFIPLPTPTARTANIISHSRRNSGWRFFLSWWRRRILMKLSKDLKEFIGLLNSRKIKYLLVGGHAVAFHGFPRYTGDIDFFIETSPENALLVSATVQDFGFANLALKPEDFRPPETIIQLGRSPNRIDILTSVTAVSFEEAWKTRVETSLDGLPISVIGKDLLVRNKLATARPQDLADVNRMTTGNDSRIAAKKLKRGQKK